VVTGPGHAAIGPAALEGCGAGLLHFQSVGGGRTLAAAYR
jgi:hypothetical protein